MPFLSDSMLLCILASNFCLWNNAVFSSENSLMTDMGMLREEGRVIETSPNTDNTVCVYEHKKKSVLKLTYCLLAFSAA